MNKREQDGKFALLLESEAAVQAETRRERQRRQQKDRTERLRSASQALGFNTIDKLAGAILAMSAEEQEAIAEILPKWRRRWASGFLTQKRSQKPT